MKELLVMMDFNCCNAAVPDDAPPVPDLTHATTAFDCADVQSGSNMQFAASRWTAGGGVLAAAMEVTHLSKAVHLLDDEAPQSRPAWYA